MSEFILDETHKVPRLTTEARVHGAELVVVEGPSRGTHVALPTGGARIGSSDGCTLQISDRSVSRVHCQLKPLADAFRLTDSGSTNGTFVGTARIVEALISVGTIVRVGNSAFRVDAQSEPNTIALSTKAELGELVGGSPQMRELYAILERISETNATVLIQGETGTGKDVAARTIHSLSSRKSGPFVPIDCGSLPENLVESELFGHMRGAFTGAISSRSGVFEEAQGGTLFLDEIGEMPFALQSKLLRAIETRQVRRVGGNTFTPVDVRIVAATNRSLARCVNEGTFREDLYYRLAVVEVVMPPLRERPGDIPALANRLFATLTGTSDALDGSFLAQLARRPWPGNVRELRNVIERAVAMQQARPAVVATEGSPGAMPAGLESIVPLSLPLKEARDAWTREFERIYLEAMLRKTNFNVTKAAEAAGVSRRFLQRLCVRLGIRVQELEDDA